MKQPNGGAGEAVTTASRGEPCDPSEKSAVAALMDSWEAMSSHYLAGRRNLLDSAVEQLVQRFDDREATIVELGSGPGGMLARLATAIPSARLIGVEIDPMLRRVCQLGASRHAPTRIQVVDADLADPQWTKALPVEGGSAEVVIAIQVLHYFPPRRFAELVSEIRSLLVNGGVLVHLDRVPTPNGRPHAFHDAADDAVDPWSSWWVRAAAASFLTDAVQERQRWLRGRPLGSAEYHPDEHSMRMLFAQAGLGTVLFERRLAESLLTIVQSDH